MRILKELFAPKWCKILLGSELRILKELVGGLDGHGCPVPLQKKKAADAALEWV